MNTTIRTVAHELVLATGLVAGIIAIYAVNVNDRQQEQIEVLSASIEAQQREIKKLSTRFEARDALTAAESRDHESAIKHLVNALLDIKSRVADNTSRIERLQSK